jgi:hypothetical protein
MLYSFLFARRAASAGLLFSTLFLSGLTRFFTLVVGRLAAFVARLATRRISGFASATFSVKALCTAPAFAAIVPSVDPMDSATLVRIGSFLDALWLSTETLLYQQKSFRDRAGKTSRRRPVLLNRSPPLDHADQNNNDGQHEQDMHEPTERVGADHTQKPQNNQDYRNRPKQVHVLLSSSCSFS